MDHGRLNPHDEDVAALLAALGHAEREAAGDLASQWAGVERALARPGVPVRLPLGWAAAWRLGALVARPAFAASLVAAGAGVGLGVWLGVTAGRPASTAVASEFYAASGLDGAPSGGFETGFLDVQEPATETTAGGGGNGNGTRVDTTRGRPGS